VLDTMMQDLGVDLRREFDQAARDLESTGLSSYESKAYVALVAMGFGTADDIAGLSRIPRTSSYKVLKGLEEKGFVEWEVEEAIPGRGGHPRRLFHVTGSEIAALKVARDALLRLWEGLEGVLGD